MTDHKPHTLAAAMALLCIAAPAWAGGISDAGQHRGGPSGPGPSIVGGSGGVGGAGGSGGAGGAGGLGGAGGSAAARSTAGAAAGASAIIGAGAGAATGGAGGVASAAIGNGAGAATIAPGAINAGGNNVITQAPPGFALPSFGGGQCATVGFGIAISPSGGGAFGPAWESTNCRNYYIAVTLIQAGRVQQGMDLLAMITPEAAAVMAPAAVPAPGGAPAVISAQQPKPFPEWCVKARQAARPTDAQIASLRRSCS